MTALVALKEGPEEGELTAEKVMIWMLAALFIVGINGMVLWVAWNVHSTLQDAEDSGKVLGFKGMSLENKVKNALRQGRKGPWKFGMPGTDADLGDVSCSAICEGRASGFDAALALNQRFLGEESPLNIIFQLYSWCVLLH